MKGTPLRGHLLAPHPAQHGHSTAGYWSRSWSWAQTHTHIYSHQPQAHQHCMENQIFPCLETLCCASRSFKRYLFWHSASDPQLHLQDSKGERTTQTELKCWNWEQISPDPRVWPQERQTTTSHMEINPVTSFSTVLGHLWHRMWPDLSHLDCRSPGMPMQTKEAEGPMTWCLHRPEQLLWVLLPPLSLEACFYF